MKPILSFSDWSRLSEQEELKGFTQPSKKQATVKTSQYSCVPSVMQEFVELCLGTKKAELIKALRVDEPTFKLLVKAAIGIIGRETKYGQVTSTADVASEITRSTPLIPGGSILGDTIDFVSRKALNQQQSLGPAQFTRDAWQKYDLDSKVGPFNSSFGFTQHGLASLYSIGERYLLAKSRGLTDSPSSNPIVSKYLNQQINGTGSNSLDLAILAHNFGDGVVTRWCETSHPLYASPCEKSNQTPFKTKESFSEYKERSGLLKAVAKVNPKLVEYPGTLKVQQGKVIPGFFPNMSGGTHTSIGYVEAVATEMRKLTCF